MGIDEVFSGYGGMTNKHRRNNPIFIQKQFSKDGT